MQIVIDLLGSLFGARITIEQQLCDPPCYAKADISQFETALVNLAVNAQDAMGGQGRLTFKVEPATSIPAMRDHPIVTGAFVMISVADTGTGIEAEQIPKLFEPFFTTKDVGKGTGLGLSQVHGFAKQSGGEVGVETLIGRGSTFSLYLPESAPPAVATKVPAEMTATGPQGGGICVLVVEDNEDVGRFATEMLHDLGYATAWAANAGEALQMLANEGSRYDLMFSDVIMPGMNGVELAEEVRRTKPDLPVVLTSGYSNVLAEEGSHGFKLIHKPYSVEALSRVIRTALGEPASA